MLLEVKYLIMVKFVTYLLSLHLLYICLAYISRLNCAQTMGMYTETYSTKLIFSIGFFSGLPQFLAPVNITLSHLYSR
jgi:hypothetical protein